eukprot:CAMPEP_0194229888 /NCGR_PEP_ID=MMETSP0156-20130528/44120_1 /TAXON_ID=33649 /ORGANISM="Thalassionema nitzschioides, Strain L26-B" /LENGTH=385 /DNA_ID=CAMNT_0038962451 /DNA_START=17 /DNA_END=1174 /DNA_ORIENTATION=-
MPEEEHRTEQQPGSYGTTNESVKDQDPQLVGFPAPSSLSIQYQAHETSGSAQSSGDATEQEAEEKDTEDETALENEAGSFGQMKVADNLQLNIDRCYQMHRLAGVYFYFQHFWFLFLPPMALTMISGILAFLIDSGIPFSEVMRSSFSVIVGSISIVNVFLQNLNNELNFGHRAKSHKTLALSLKNLLDHLLSIQIRQRRSESQSKDLDSTSDPNLIKDLEKEFETIGKQNDSNLPPEIMIAYDLASTRISLQLFPPVSFNRKNKDAYNKVRYINIMGIVNNELFNQFMNSRGWPFFLPKAESVVQRAMNKVKWALKNESGLAIEDTQFWRQPQACGDSLYKLLLEQQKKILRANIEDNVELKKKDSKEVNEESPLVNDPTKTLV